MPVFNLFRGKTDQERFAHALIAGLRQRGLADARYDAGRFGVVLDHRGEIIFLGAPFSDWLVLPQSLKASWLDRFLGRILEHRVSNKTFEEAIPFLTPVVRYRADLENQPFDPLVGVSGVDHDDTFRVIGGCLAVFAVVADDANAMIVNHATLDLWRRSFDEVMTVCVSAVREHGADQFVELQEGAFVSQGHFPEAAWMLAPEIFSQLPVRGDPVVVVMDRSGVAVAGDQDRHGLRAVAAYVRGDKLEGRLYVPSGAAELPWVMPLVLRDDTWIPFRAEDVDQAVVDDIRLRQAVKDYEEQRPLLEARMKAAGRDVHLPTCARCWHDGWSYNLAVYEETGRMALAPQVDGILIRRDEDAPLLLRTWADLEAACGPFGEEPGVYPPRYLVPWPDKSAWARLEACRTPAWVQGDMLGFMQEHGSIEP